jgi:hypothetical protein
MLEQVEHEADQEVSPARRKATGGARAPACTLSNSDLKAGGLVVVRAWVKADKVPAESRQQTHRAKLEAAGLKQFNVYVPDDQQSRAAVKSIAKALAQKVRSPEEIMRFTATNLQVRVDEIEPRTPWRHWLVRVWLFVTSGKPDYRNR